ncbi:MAG: TolC family protein, partial [Pseudomonadota bacterium]
VTIGASDTRSLQQQRQTLVAAEMDLVNVEADHLDQRVALLLALGGDWKPETTATGTGTGTGT